MPERPEERKSLIDRLIDCREKELRHEPCIEDRRDRKEVRR